MPLFENKFSKSGVSNIIFAASVVILIIMAGSGYGLYANTLSHSGGNHVAASSSSTGSEMMGEANTTNAYQFTPKSGAMITNAWLNVAPLGMHEYAVSIHAEGLEANGTYLVEGPVSTGSMAVVPISNESSTMNQTSASEFQTNSNGTGQFWIIVNSNPATTFESLELSFLPNMSMQNAMIVATASFSSSTMISTTMSESMT